MDALQAISDATRRRILSSLQRRPQEELTVDEIADEHRVHRTVAYQHLEKLAEASLVSRGSRKRGRGRPARTYRHDGTASEISHPPRQHRLLASLLGAGLGRLGRPGIASAVEEGRRLGAELAAGCDGQAEAMARLCALGSPYELARGEILARNCVFREACACAPHVVCAAHAAIIEGAMGAGRTGYSVVPLGPDGDGGCRFQLVTGPSLSPASVPR